MILLKIKNRSAVHTSIHLYICLFLALTPNLLLAQSGVNGKKPVFRQVQTHKTQTLYGRRSLEERVQLLKNPASKEILVVAHRGDWRNAPENSLQAIQNCIDMGVDIVEIDIQKTKDGQLILMHDRTLDRTTTGKGSVTEWTLDSLKTLHLRHGHGQVAIRHQIPTLEQALNLAKGKVLINLDKCYDLFEIAYPILEKTGTLSQVILKAKLPVSQVEQDLGRYLDKLLFMPIIDLDKADAQQIITDYQLKLPPVAFEFVFKTDTSSVLDNFAAINKQGSRVWLNSLWSSLNAGHDDDLAVTDPEGSYGWLVRKGAGLIQTDRPSLLIQYLSRNQ